MRKRRLTTPRKIVAKRDEMKTAVRFSNPELVHQPLGAFSHSAAIREGTELFFMSGQLGVTLDGSIPPASHSKPTKCSRT